MTDVLDSSGLAGANSLIACPVFLYEIYADEAAFAAHLKMPHFIEFDAATKAMIKGRTIGKLWIENDNGK